MRRKFFQENNNSDEETWLLTYGDMMTLLLVFFILLFALSTMNKMNLQDIVNSMTNTFGSTKKLTEEQKKLKSIRDSLGLEKVNLKELEDLNKVYGQIDTIVKKQKLEDKVEMDIDNRGVVIRANESIFFRSGKSFVLNEGKKFLYRIYPVLKSTDYEIQVEGHTDDIPIHNREFSSNWELSVGRATSVVRFFIETCKLKPERFSAMGFAEFRPLVPNEDSQSRAKNRRVEIIILRSKYQEMDESDTLSME